MLLQLCGAKTSEGVFVGLFLSMSSTAVVCAFSCNGPFGVLSRMMDEVTMARVGVFGV